MQRPAINKFPRAETVTLESTYGSKEDILPPRIETEEKFLNIVKETIKKGGKILLPELGLGHSQETVLRVEEAIRTGILTTSAKTYFIKRARILEEILDDTNNRMFTLYGNVIYRKKDEYVITKN